jgi:hypothetical protein
MSIYRKYLKANAEIEEQRKFYELRIFNLINDVNRRDNAINAMRQKYQNERIINIYIKRSIPGKLLLWIFRKHYRKRKVETKSQ